MKSYATRIALVTLLLLVLAASVCEATPRRGLTLLVVPSRYSIMQIGFDTVRRFGVALVSYQGDASSENPDLFAWNGMEWVKITLQEYADCSFMQAAPTRTVLVGDEDLLPPMLFAYAEGWSVEVLDVPSVRTADIVNSFSKIFSFRKRDWEWFARRYNLELDDLNSERRDASWYDRQEYDDKWAHKWKWLRRRSQDPQPVPETEPVEPVGEQPDFMTAPLATPEIEESGEVYGEPVIEVGEIDEAEVVTEDMLPPPFEDSGTTVDSESISVAEEESTLLPEPAPVMGDMMSPAVEGGTYEAVETYPVK